MNMVPLSLGIKDNKQTDVALLEDKPHHGLVCRTGLPWKPYSKTLLWAKAAVTSMIRNLGESRSNQWSYNQCGKSFSLACTGLGTAALNLAVSTSFDGQMLSQNL